MNFQPEIAIEHVPSQGVTLRKVTDGEPSHFAPANRWDVLEITPSDKINTDLDTVKTVALDSYSR